ncbi:hypothetical protein [Dysosmobacter sp.]|uniref:hypothetical protein n=1 Tax=Dysosmobacter sp. TaxID=2591382 RepID=UPI002D7FE7E8|nr:hypothetical protein [Dysosmobacter sp.]MCI6054397.1 hypothetical protein [Dysosmobacter sp.]
MTLYLTHGNGEESIPLELPAASSQVEEIDIRLDDICSGEGNFRISDVKSSVKGLWQFSDGEMTRWNRSEFIGVLDDKFLPEWAKPKLAELQAQEQTDAPTMGGMNMK